MKTVKRRLVDKDELIKNIRVDICPEKSKLVTGYLTVNDIENFPEIDVPSDQETHLETLCICPGLATSTCTECGYYEHHSDHASLSYNYCPSCGRRVSKEKVSAKLEGGI